MRLRVRDRVRFTDGGEVARVEGDRTAGAVAAELVARWGLPVATPGGEPITYDLVSSGEPLDPAARLDDLGTTDELRLTSPVGARVWGEVERTLRLVAAEAAGIARQEVTASRQRLVDAANGRVRDVVRAATGDLEAAAISAVDDVGRRVSLVTARRVRRLVARLRRTGAVPDEVQTLAVAAGRLGQAAQAALVVPVAAVAVAGVVVATGAGIAAQQALDRPVPVTVVSPTPTLPPSPAPTPVEPDLDALLARVEADVLAHLAGDAESPWVAALLGEVDVRADGLIDTRFSAPFRGRTVRPVVRAGDSLWGVAAASLRREPYWDHGCDVPAVARPSTEQVGRHAATLWLANVGVVGASPDVLTAGDPLQLVCPTVVPAPTAESDATD